MNENEIEKLFRRWPVQTTADARIVRDDTHRLKVFPPDASDELVATWIDGFRKGFDLGAEAGRKMFRRDLRELLGLDSTSRDFTIEDET